MEGPRSGRDYVGRVVVPILFILLLPVAFAAEVKNDDVPDNVFTFVYDAEADEIVGATSSKMVVADDDVDISVVVVESESTSPLAGRVRFLLVTKKPVRYDGTVVFKVIDGAGTTAYETTKPVSFTLRKERSKRARSVTFRFDVPTGEYQVDITFSS